MASQLQIIGMDELRSDLLRAIEDFPKYRRLAIAGAGLPIVRETSAIAAHKSGRLAGSYRVQATSSTGSIVSRVPYGAKAEWSGKKGWMKYGAPGRFAAKVIEDRGEQIVIDIYEGMKHVITIRGWAR